MLHKQGTVVYLVSGGFQNMIKPIALDLHIPQDNIYANEILFDAKGKYIGFDRTAPTSASGGSVQRTWWLYNVFLMSFVHICEKSSFALYGICDALAACKILLRGVEIICLKF
jgi:hypothetical protein